MSALLSKSLGILAKSLLSLKLLSCPGICGTGTKMDWPGKKRGALLSKSFGILAKSLLSLKLLSYPGICGTGTNMDWPGKK